MPSEPESVSAELQRLVAREIGEAGGWLPFDRFMHLALYAPGLGYYAHGGRKFGTMPGSGSDFVTAPELSPWFGRLLAVQVRQALAACGGDTVFEFGAGSGALAEQLLDALGDSVRRYAIVDVSASLAERQRERLARFAPRVEWLQRWPERLDGVVVANELLDAMPVQLLHWDGEQWMERGVSMAADGGLDWSDRSTALRPPVEAEFLPGTVIELPLQARAFVTSMAERLHRGAALFIDYGFPEAEFYHPQRTGGTLICHRAHRSDAQPLADVGLKDITAHVDFTAIALAGQDAGMDVVGYTSQARFLLNCGLPDALAAADLRERAMAQRLVAEHEMGELFKVLMLARGCRIDPVGFRAGDRTHRL